jgi:hypothetical protein
MGFRDYGNPPLGPFSEGELTNPSDNDVAADTGALPNGSYEMLITVGASAAADVMVQRRNAANDDNVGATVVLKAPAGQSGQYRMLFALKVDERVRVIMDDALTGTISVAINAERLT